MNTRGMPLNWRFLRRNYLLDIVPASRKLIMSVMLFLSNNLQVVDWNSENVLLRDAFLPP